MVNVLIVDDERLARDRVAKFLSKRSEVKHWDEASNGVEAIEKIKDGNFQIVFLDVQMPEISGFDVLAHVSERNFQVVFQTAYDKYAIKAFEEQACDYLLKPFDKDRFDKAFERAIVNIDKYQKLRIPYLKKLVVKHVNKSVVINLDDVLCFTSKDHYTFLMTLEKEFIIDMSLTDLEAKLDPQQFKRCHRNSIVSKKFVKSIIHNSNMEVELANGLILSVSRNQKSQFSHWCQS